MEHRQCQRMPANEYITVQKQNDIGDEIGDTGISFYSFHIHLQSINGF